MAAIAFKLSLILLMLLIQMQDYCSLHTDVASSAASLPAEAKVGAEHSDSYNIRHGRSKVRHSNEKEQVLFGSGRGQNAATVKAITAKRNAAAAAKADGRKNTTIVSQRIDTADYDNEIEYNAEIEALQNSTTRETRDKMYEGSGYELGNRLGKIWSSYSTSSIQTGNGHLFGSDYWRNSDANGSLINSTEANSAQRLRQMQLSMTATRSPKSAVSRRSLGSPFKALLVTETPDAAGAGGIATTEAPVTHRIRKLHMKKIMESIRNNVGAKLSKNHHRSLLTAEQLQGRPMDVDLNQAKVAATDDMTTDSDVSAEDSASNENGGSFERSYEAASAVDEEDEGENFDSLNYDGGNDIRNVYGRIENVNSDIEVASDSVADESGGGSMCSEDASNNALEADVDNSSNELVEVLQLADDLDTQDNSLEDVYQNDDYLATTPSYVTTKSNGSTELNGNAIVFTTLTTFQAESVNSFTTEVLSDDVMNVSTTTTHTSALKPLKKLTTRLQLVPKTTATTKLAPLPTMPIKNFVQPKLAPNQTWKNQSIPVAHQNEITAIERPMWSTGNDTPTKQLGNARVKIKPPKTSSNFVIYYSELPELAGTISSESGETANDTEEYSEFKSRNYTTNKFLTPSTSSSTTPKAESDEYGWSASNISLEPNQLASTSVGGIGLERQQAYDIEEISFENVRFDNLDDITMDDGHMDDNRYAHGFPVSSSADDMSGGDDGNETEGEDDTNRFLAGVVDAANENEIYDWDEISRNNRRNLMRGRDVVTRFLQIVETQHLLGANCEAGTSLNLGEGVVDRYAQDRFRVEAEVAVNRANMLTRIFKMTTPAAQADVNLLHASVLSMVEFDDDIFAAGNCFDWNEHPAQTGLFCPFAYRLPAPNLGAILAKDLSMEYHYLGNTSEWFFQARKNAGKVIARNEQYLKSFHLYSNKTEERIEDDTLAVKYEDGRWSKPYYDCGGGNIWMLTYTVPFFGYENGTYHFKGTSGIDIDLRRVDIDQCPQRNSPGTTQPLNIFAGTDKCKQRTTMCEALKGLGFRRGSYKCVCRKGYFFPDTMSTQKFFNGSLLEEEYEKLMLGKNSTYNIINEYECLPCAEGCDYCEDGSPCIAALNWPMRTSIMVLACTVIGLLPPAAWFTFRYQQVKVVRAASPALLRVIALGAFFIYCTTIVMYPNPNLYTCTARIWLREIGFSLTYGALMLKTWRISVIFRVRSAKAVKITDAALLKRLGIICGVIGTCLLVRTLVAPPDVVIGRTADDLKAFLCKTDYWDYTFTSMEVLFLAWGVRLCIMVRKAPSEFNESRFISMTIYNEFLMTCFLNVSMLFLQSPANPDLLYIIFFCHTQLTVTPLLGLIFGSKVYIVLRSGRSHQETIGMGAKSSGAKFNFRPQVRTYANPSSVTTSTVPAAGTTSGDTKLSDQEALEEIRQLSKQLQRIQEMAPPKGVAVMTISSLLDGLKTPGSMIMVAAAASQAATSNNQLTVLPLTPSAVGAGCASPGGGGALPLLSLNTEMEKYNQQLQSTHNNNITAVAPLNASSGSGVQTTRPRPSVLEVETSTTTVEEYALVQRADRAINTDLTRSEDFHQQALGCAQGHIICTRCLVISKEHYFSCRPFTPPHGLRTIDGVRASRIAGTCVGDDEGFRSATCQQLGSPQPEGSISFANIKLECMCSQPDLDLDMEADVPQRRRINVRSAATNTPPSTGSSRRRRSSRAKTCSTSWQDVVDVGVSTDVSYRICDNCKNKYRNSNKYGGRKFRKTTLLTSSLSATATAAAATAMKSTNERQAYRNILAARTGVSQTRSNDLLERQLPLTMSTFSSSIAAGEQRAKVHSTDDIIFYTTTDESSTNSDEDSTDGAREGTCSRLRRRQLELTCQSTSALSTASTGCATLRKNIAADAETSQGSVVAAGITRSAVGPKDADSVAANTQSLGNVSHASNVSTKSGETAPNGGDNNTKTNGSGRAKRPDKLVLDLNDRSKYTKEVSV